jgi:hypothetical protein
MPSCVNCGERGRDHEWKVARRRGRCRVGGMKYRPRTDKPKPVQQSYRKGNLQERKLLNDMTATAKEIEAICAELTCRCGHINLHHMPIYPKCSECGAWLRFDCEECVRTFPTRNNSRAECHATDCSCTHYSTVFNLSLSL